MCACVKIQIEISSKPGNVKSVATAATNDDNDVTAAAAMSHSAHNIRYSPITRTV